MAKRDWTDYLSWIYAFFLVFQRAKSCLLWAAIIVALVMIITLVGSFRACSGDNSNSLAVKVDTTINESPVQLQQIRDIGQWEFLSITDEELVDTVSRHFLGDHQLVRIYYGTPRLGLDLSKARKDWIRIKEDSTIIAQLPPIQLLDENFIDETRSRSFIESGSWSHEDRQKLYDKARRKMRSRALSQNNIATVRKLAEEQFRVLFNSMGYQKTEITFDK